MEGRIVNVEKGKKHDCIGRRRKVFKRRESNSSRRKFNSVV